ncbi:MAG: Gfo/Idh/MocA family oxidoreductase [Planctomycetota bacterium]|nr:Gfo/Idh/MocA family oxidoreductase [Planctomycetota bacterium]
MVRKPAVSRRAFLKGVAAAGAAMACPAIVPSSVFGADGKVAPSNRITMGCIGVGGQGGGNQDAFLGESDCQVLAVADVDKNNAANGKKRTDDRYRNQDCVAYRDFRELLARDDIDTISLGTPDHWHAIPVIMAARAGKDVYGEKPFSHDLREGRAMVTALSQYGRVWQTGSWQRSGGNFRFASELVRNGRIGKVHTVEVGLPTGGAGGSEQFTDPPPEMDYDFWVGPSPWAPYSKDRTHWNWRWQLDYGGGQMMDWIGHHGDIAQWGLGTDYTGPVEVEPVNSEWPKEGLWTAPMSYKFICTFANGVKMIVANDRQVPKGMGARWIGDKGWVWVDRGGFDADPKSILKDTIRPDEINLYRSPGHHRNFLDCVKSRRLTITPAEVAHRSASIGHLGQIAMQVGRKFRWNPDTEEILGDPTAAGMLGRAKREPWNIL